MKMKTDKAVGWKDQNQRCRAKRRNWAGKGRLKMINMKPG